MRRSLSFATILLALLVSCGGDETTESTTPEDNPSSDAPATTVDDAGGATETTTSPDTGDGDAPAQPEVTEMGTFTVNETEFVVTFLNRCIPFEGEDSEVIDLQPVAQGQGAKLNLNGTADSLEISVDGATITEMFGSRSFSADSFDGEIQSSIDGDRWTGSATLNDVFDEAEPVSVVWDVMIPDEIVDCNL